MNGQPKLLPLALGALGIVFGNIGTSPLYALAECVSKGPDSVVRPYSFEVTLPAVMGLLSLFFWSLTLVVTVKYLAFIMRANNRGQGGIFALLALVPAEARSRRALVLAALFGAALLYGDGIITPAISVLSAVEGLAIAEPGAKPYVVPVTLTVLAVLFLAQKRGHGTLGRFFGPVMLAWFGVLAVLGARALIDHPAVLAAVNPMYAVRLFAIDPVRAFKVLGGVALCVTGSEALYAELGSFGLRPIRLGWYAIVMPALVLNYFGQGAHLVTYGWVEEPFWAIVPTPLLYPVVALAVAAALIASQTLIASVFSLTRQAVQLGYLPRLTIVHTSSEDAGQIFIPEVNTALTLACLALVVLFRDSTSLAAAAYGLAVTGTMVITSTIYFVVVIRTWRWSVWKAFPVLVLFLALDLPLFLANALKFREGGWFPVAVGVGLFTLMVTWKEGREALAALFRKSMMPLATLLEDLRATTPHRVRGTAVFMSGNPEGTPPVLLHHLKHNQVLHRQVVLLSIIQENVPTVPRDEVITVREEDLGFYRVIWRTGFMETPNVPKILARAHEFGMVSQPSTTSYFLGRETLLTSGKAPMLRWRKLLFAFVSRNALPATSYFGIPPGRVVELGIQVEL